MGNLFLHTKEKNMIEFNGKQYSGAVVSEDNTELIVSVSTADTLQDLCLALNDVKAVTEINNGGTFVHNVSMATNVGVAMPGVYTVKFSKKQTVIEEMNEAIDKLLLMVLGG